MPASGRSAGSTGLRSSLGEGLRVVTGSRVLWVTMASLSLAMLGLGAINVLFVPLIVNVLHESPVWFGPLEGAQTASMVLAAGLVGVLAARLRPTTIVVVGSLGVGLIIGLVGAVSAVWQVMVLMFAVGWFITPFQAAVVTILQSHSTDATRGRVMSLLNASMSATSVVSMAVAGLLAASLGVSAAFLLGGAVCVSAGVVALALYPRGTAATIADGRVAQPAS
jgi:MFS family permease